MKPSGKVKRFAKLRNPAFIRFVKTKPCVICGSVWVDPHHLSGRKAPDLGTVIPLCRGHHDEWHDHGRMTFCIKYAVDLHALALGLAAEFLQGGSMSELSAETLTELERLDLNSPSTGPLAIGFTDEGIRIVMDADGRHVAEFNWDDDAAHYVAFRSALPALLAAVRDAEGYCGFSEFSSRCCERGTRGCEIRHLPTYRELQSELVALRARLAQADADREKYRPKVAVNPCKNFSPPEWTGRWRDWHRGHGCNLDDGKPRSDEAVDASRGSSPERTGP